MGGFATASVAAIRDALSAAAAHRETVVALNKSLAVAPSVPLPASSAASKLGDPWPLMVGSRLDKGHKAQIAAVRSSALAGEGNSNRWLGDRCEAASHLGPTNPTSSELQRADLRSNSTPNCSATAAERTHRLNFRFGGAATIG